MTPESLPLIYFGKLPCRGDFVRARSYVAETNAIDQWVSQAITTSGDIGEGHLVNELAHKNALKKDTPKETFVLNFSHIDTTTNVIITGILLPSHDSSDRRYPLIGFSVIHSDKPKSWMNYLPIKSLTLWEDTYRALITAQSQTNSDQVTDALNNCLLSIDKNASTHYYDFINTTTLQDIALLMHIDKSQLIQQIIATGLLFLPTFTKGFSGLNKSICWTLSADKTTAVFIATFWHDLIHGFYQPHHLHLNTYLYRHAEHYELLLSFSTPDGQVLSELSNLADTYPKNWVSIEDSSWTQSYINEDIGLTRFNKMLLQDDLYLYDTRQLFKKIFLAQ